MWRPFLVPASEYGGFGYDAKAVCRLFSRGVALASPFFKVDLPRRGIGPRAPRMSRRLPGSRPLLALLRAGPPACPATVLTALRFSRLAGSLSPSTRSGRQCRHAPSPRSMQEQQTGLTSPICRTPPGQSAVTRQALPGRSYCGPVLMPSTELRHVNSDPRKPGTAHRLSDPHLTHPLRLFHIAYHDGLQPTAACGGLQPPTAGRLRRAKPSSPAQHHVRKSLPTNRTPFHVRATRRFSTSTASAVPLTSQRSCAGVVSRATAFPTTHLTAQTTVGLLSPQSYWLLNHCGGRDRTVMSGRFAPGVPGSDRSDRCYPASWA